MASDSDRIKYFAITRTKKWVCWGLNHDKRDQRETKRLGRQRPRETLTRPTWNGGYQQARDGPRRQTEWRLKVKGPSLLEQREARRHSLVLGSPSGAVAGLERAIAAEVAWG
jgi:hypothetical protein